METTVIDVQTEETEHKPRYSKSRKGIGGRKPAGIIAKTRSAISAEVVERVAARFAKGMPIRYAIAMEKDERVTQDRWEKLCSTNPRILRILDSHRGMFLEPLLADLWAEKDWKAKAWLAERRFTADFSPPAVAQTIINNDNRQVKLGIDANGLAELANIALSEAKRLKAAKQVK